MTDLTGAELDLAVARVMGLRDVYEEDDSAWRGDGSVRGTVEWRPSQGGAAAWEVLGWVRAQGWGVEFVDIDPPPYTQREAIIRCYGTPYSYGSRGPTDAIALCRAVVALGETG